MNLSDPVFDGKGGLAEQAMKAHLYPPVKNTKKLVYLIGSLRNPSITELANAIEANLPIRVFDDWQCAGEHADDAWRDHEKARGYSYRDALERPAAKHVFQFDKKWIDASDAVVLVCPAGKSGHLEFGYAIGSGKPGFILLDDPERWDVMYQFADGVTESKAELIQWLHDVTA